MGNKVSDLVEYAPSPKVILRKYGVEGTEINP